MSTASAQASKFYEQVVAEGKVFTFDDGNGYLVFPVGDVEVVPFWSTRTRCLKIQGVHSKYAGRTISEETLQEFLEKTLPLLEEERIRVGVNWSGKRLAGYDVSVADMRRNLRHWIAEKSKS
jgi:NADPH:quinone reductase-like Zn-dependent oxidoreductase